MLAWIDLDFSTLAFVTLNSVRRSLRKCRDHIRARSASTGCFGPRVWSLDVPVGKIRKFWRVDGVVNPVMVAVVDSGLKQWSWTSINWIAGRWDGWLCFRLIVIILSLRPSILCLSSICTSLLRQHDCKGDNSCMASPSCVIGVVREFCYSSRPHVEITLTEVDRI